MKRQSFRVFATLLLAVLLAMTCAAAFADGDVASVTFTNDRTVVFQPGSNYTGSDLFTNMKNLAPGDQRTQLIQIENQVTDYDYIDVYMQAIGHNYPNNPLSPDVASQVELDEMNRFLEQLTMTVSYNGSQVFSEQADKSVPLDAPLGEPLYLGRLEKGTNGQLTAVLTVPIELGNTYANMLGEIDWKFYCEYRNNGGGGGGGGGNGGGPGPGSFTSQTVRKVWEDNGQDRPSSVQVVLKGNGEIIDRATLSAANQWTHAWGDLNTGVKWTVEEVNVDQRYTDSYQQQGSTMVIINTLREEEKKPEVVPAQPVEEPVDLTVVKKWNDNGKNRPMTAVVTLYNGKEAVETVKLGSWNKWTHSWTDLDGSGQWQVIEQKIPAGYVPSYKVKGNVVTITNTSTLLQTGQHNWPVPVLCGLGVLLLAAGLRRSRRSGRQS